MRTKFGKYKEYHTSLDNLDIISEKSLQNSLKISKLFIEYIEKSNFQKAKLFANHDKEIYTQL